MAGSSLHDDGPRRLAPASHGTPGPPGRGASRREFLREAGILGVAAGALLSPDAEAARRAAGRLNPALRRRRPRVAVLGGGMGGLAAAHELAERGFAVTVVEPKALGGKARSISVSRTAGAGRADLPGEHGFRFFPGFYKNIPDTMRRIPVKGQPNGVFDSLISANQELFVFDGNNQLWLPPNSNSDGPLETMRSVVTAIGIAGQVPPNEIEYFARRLEVFLTSSDARRLGQWEYVGWWDFVNAEHFSPEYQRVFGTGLTKDLVAAKGKKASARTVALMGEAFVYAILASGNAEVRSESGYGDADRLLNAPTNEAWINPWIRHLRSLGVRFITGYRAAELRVRNGRIASAALMPSGFPDSRGRLPRHASQIEADWFICAMPVEQMVRLLNADLLAADPFLDRIRRLQTDWMNGIQFFLNRPPDVPIKGHVAYLESAWALTSIDQGLLWNRNIQKQYGNGRVRDILSVDISDFFSPGVLYRKPAAHCTPHQIAREVWAQLKLALNTPEKSALSDDMIVTWFLDPAIHYPHGTGKPAANREPLLINTAGSRDDRPEANTAVANLFLASDYVRTNIDLATMEGANEAGRKATAALLERAGSHASPPALGELWQPAELDAVRNEDEQRYKAGEPNLLDTVPAGVPA